MINWHQTDIGYIGVNTDGTIVRHPHKYVAHDSFTFKATYDQATGRCIKIEPYVQKNYVLFNLQSGEILAIHTGFNIHDALNNTHPFVDVPDGHAVDSVESSEECKCCGSVLGYKDFVPRDFIIRRNDFGVNAYRWDSVCKKFIRKKDEEIDNEFIVKFKKPR